MKVSISLVFDIRLVMEMNNSLIPRVYIKIHVGLVKCPFIKMTIHSFNQIIQSIQIKIATYPRFLSLISQIEQQRH